jgi:hypothetical protein
MVGLAHHLFITQITKTHQTMVMNFIRSLLKHGVSYASLSDFAETQIQKKTKEI